MLPRALVAMPAIQARREGCPKPAIRVEDDQNAAESLATSDEQQEGGES